ncbi:MAG: tripartite tricarboxylate transporter substrate binding protein [Mycobacteriales bacterium]
MPRPPRIAHRVVLAAALAGLVACGSDEGGSDTAAPAGGAADEAVFDGVALDLVVPYEPGGGYDAYARAMAPYLEQCLGATIVVKNEPGAGGLLATNKTAAAPTDADRIQIVNTAGLVSAQLAGAEGANFDLNDLSWIGRVSSPPNVIVVGANSPIKSFQDMVDASSPIRFVAQGEGANDYIAPNIVAQAYDFPYEIITGFAGSSEARTAVIAGDADAHALPVDSQLGAIESGDVRPIVTIDEEPDPLLPDTPTIYDTDPGEDAKAIIDSLVAMGQTGRALMASPEMDDARLTALREGFQCAVEQDDLLAELEEQKRPLDPLSGEETAQLIQDVLQSPEEFTALVTESY